MTTADLNTMAAACTRQKFSWQRVWRLFKYLLPTLRKQMIAIPIVSALCAVAYSYASIYEISVVGMASLTCISFMFYLTPIGLARNDNRLMVAQLPLSASEKLTFLLVYFWGVMGFLSLGLAIIVLRIIGGSEETVALSLAQVASRGGGDSFVGFMCNVAISLCFQSIVLYGVVTGKKNRLMRGVVNLLVSYLVLVLSSFVGGAIIGIYAASTDTPPSPENMKAVIGGLLIVLGIVALIVMCIIIHKLYKRLKYCGF